MINKSTYQKIFAFFSLFTSTGTLLCCALPALIATIAGGTAVGSLLTVFPWLVPLSVHKTYIFLIAGTFIIISGFMIFNSKNTNQCSTNGFENCQTAKTFSKWMFLFSCAIYFVGVFFAYMIVLTLKFYENL